MANFESSVKVIPYSQERVYAKLSDLSNLESVKDRLPEDKVQDTHVPDCKVLPSHYFQN